MALAAATADTTAPVRARLRARLLAPSRSEPRSRRASGSRRATTTGARAQAPNSSATPPRMATNAHRSPEEPLWLPSTATNSSPSPPSIEARPHVIMRRGTGATGRRPASAASVGMRAAVRAGSSAATVAAATPTATTATKSDGRTT